MKKIFVLFVLIALSINIAFCGEKDKDYTVNFNGSKFHLLYSVKNKDFGGYLNEYYKKGETYNIWSELVAVHHFPNAYSPIDRISDFKDYLSSMHVPSSLTFDDKNNSAMIDFIIISDHSMPIVIEFNVFKYEKSKKCGSIAIQYAKRYTATTTMQIEEIKKDIEKNRKKLSNKVKRLEIPEIITKDIDKCISASDVSEKDNQEEIAADNIEKEALAAGDEENDSNANNDKISENQQSENTNNNAEEPIVEEKNNETAKIENNTTDENNISENIDENKEESLPDSENIKTEITEQSINEEGVNADFSTKEEVNEEVSASNEIILETDEQKNPAETAPVPETAEAITTESGIKSVKNKKAKNIDYEVTNDKTDFIAVPRTKKELKAEVKDKKLKQKEMKIQAKRQAKEDKKALKNDAKITKQQEKIKQKEEKEAIKQAKKPYKITNDNSDLIAKPRTNKELKQANKQKKQEAKKRAKEAKKKLD